MHVPKFALLLSGLVFTFVQTARADGFYVQTADVASLEGPFVRGSDLSFCDEDAIGDFLVPTRLANEETEKPGIARFLVAIPKSGAYTLWARMRCPSGKAESFTCAVGEGSKRYVLKNGAAAVRGWRWVRMRLDGKPATVTLEKGSGVFSLSPGTCTEQATSMWKMGMTRPMFCPRVDLLYLTDDPKATPSDAEARKVLGGRGKEKSNEAPRAVAPRYPLEKVSDDMLKRLGKQRVPDWMRCPRFFTKDSHRAELSHRRSGDIAQIVRVIADAGANAFRLGVYWGGDVYYQSDVTPHAPGLGGLDFLEEATKEGRKRGVRIVAYMNPNALYKSHPLCDEVAIRGADGEPAPVAPYGRFRDARYPCINHPKYRDFLCGVIREMFTRYRPDGLYIDGLSPHRCACQHCQAAYRKRWGEALPMEAAPRGREGAVWWEMSAVATPIGDPSNEAMRRYTQMQAESLAAFSMRISQTVKSEKKDAAVIFHSWPKENWRAAYDGTLTEVYISRPWRHDLWKACELADFSNQFHVPALFNIYNRTHFSSEEAVTYATQGLAGGCYPNFWNSMGMKPVFSMMRDNPGCFDFLTTVPAKYAILTRSTGVQPDHLRISDASHCNTRFLAPYVGFYSAVTRGGFPIHSVDRGSFHRELDGVRVLCLANEACLSDEQAEAIRQYVAQGGGLVATHEATLYDENGKRRDDFALADVLGVRYRQTLPAKLSVYKAVRSHPIVGEKGTTLVSAEQDALVSVTPKGADVLAATEDGTPALVINRYGKGKVVYLPGRLDAIQCDRLDPAVERLFTSALRYAGGKPPVEVDPASPVLAAAFDQPHRRIIHLVNLNGDTQYRTDRISPVEGLRLTVRPPRGRAIASVRAISGAELSCPSDLQRETETEISLSRLEDYEVLVVELDR